jgi:hypothetical protein
MAKLAPATRQEKQEYARRLVQRGYSRRQTNEALLKKYGEIIRPAMYSEFYAERVETVRAKEEARPAPRRKFRQGRQARYDWLIARHFTDDEATRLSKLRGLQDSKGIAKQVSARKALWAQFLKIAAERNWNKEQRREGWRRGLARWYKRNGYITKRTHRGKRRPSVWMWYKDIQMQLPEEDRDDSPRLHDRGFTTKHYVTPALVDWSKNLLSIRRVMEKRGRTPELRREESRVLGKIRELKRR